MGIREIEWTDFSKYRSALMGAAMLFVMFFHVSMPGDLVCCNSWGRKESDTTERLN